MQHLDRILRASVVLGMACQLTMNALSAQAAPAATDIERGPWEFAMQVGLTSFGVDQSAPGTMTTLGIDRRLGSRFTLGVEGGIGSIQSTGVCRLGNLTPFECAQDSVWPSIGVDSRWVVIDEEESASRYYAVAQVLAHGPDLVASYDLGIGLSLRAVAGVDVGIELRHRFGYDGASGGMYFFRVSR